MLSKNRIACSVNNIKPQKYPREYISHSIIKSFSYMEFTLIFQNKKSLFWRKLDTKNTILLFNIDLLYMYLPYPLIVHGYIVEVRGTIKKFPTEIIFIIIRFLISMQVQGHHPHQWDPFQIADRKEFNLHVQKGNVYIQIWLIIGHSIIWTVSIPYQVLKLSSRI